MKRPERLALLGLLLVAGALRIPGLADRASWDADQGHDMLVLRAFVQDGVVPLLGPPTSIGGVHHGAAYYGLLAPAAWLTGGDSPLAVELEIALFGIIAVAVTWWLGRAMGGPIAGLVAGLTMAVSATAVASSTFIWNPNLIACTSAIALATAWQAWTTGRARWWVLAALGAALTAQGHILGVVLAPVLLALYVADLRRQTSARPSRALVMAGVWAAVVVAVTYLPLLVHELTTGASELHALVDDLTSGGGPSAIPAAALPIRWVVILVRVLGWPLGGLITDAFGAAVLSGAAIAGIVAWRWRSEDRSERVAVRWLGLGLLWTSISLAVIAPSLATVTPGLPNDHYHAFADPMVFVLAGLGAAVAAGAARAGAAQAGSARAQRVGARTFKVGGRSVTIRQAGVGIAVAAVVAWNLSQQPAGRAPDGTYADAERAAARVVTDVAGRPFSIRSLPAFKSAEAIAYPLLVAGHPVSAGTTAPPTAAVVVICDPRFATAIGAACGGPAEDASVEVPLGPGGMRLVERFAATSRMTVSVYVPR